MLRLILLVVLMALSVFSLQAQSPTSEQQLADGIFQRLLEAELAKNYTAFVADGTLNLKAGLTKTQFDASSDLLSPRLRVGYDVQALGDLRQHGFQVYLYRLRFKDGTDDILGTLSLKDGKVAGILFK